jgi:hypothetical protein
MGGEGMKYRLRFMILKEGYCGKYRLGEVGIVHGHGSGNSYSDIDVAQKDASDISERRDEWCCWPEEIE